MQMSYWRFAAMIATSTLVMFGLMYVHTYVWDHAYFSETRAWMALLIRTLERDGVRPARKPEPPAEEMPAAEAVRSADLATTDIEFMTDPELQRMLGSRAVCRFTYAAGEAAVAAATAPGADAGRGVIKLHRRLVPMTVRYQTLAGEGFELSSDTVRVVAAPHEGTTDSGARKAEARLRIAGNLDVGYGGFYECNR